MIKIVQAVIMMIILNKIKYYSLFNKQNKIHHKMEKMSTVKMSKRKHHKVLNLFKESKKESILKKMLNQKMKTNNKRKFIYGKRSKN